MKSRTSSLFLCIIVGLIVSVFSSCGPKTDLSKGFKVTLKLSFKDAILQAAYNPTDSMLTSALEHVDGDQNVTCQIVAFLDQYEKQYPGHNPAEKFHASATGNSPTTMSKEAFRNYLIKIVSDKISKMRAVTAARIQAFFGTKAGDIKIEFKGKNMTVYVPGVTDENMLKPLFANRDGIRFWSVMRIEDIGQYLARANDTLTTELKALHKRPEKKQDSSAEIPLADLVEQGKREKEYSPSLFSILMPAVDQNGQPTGAAYIGLAAQKDTATLNSYLQKESIKHIFPPNIQFMWGAVPGKTPEGNKPLALYALLTSPEGTPLINSQDVKDANVDEQDGRVEISMTMTPPGAIKWARVTAEHVDKSIAIEVGRYVYSAPNVISRIDGGKSSITGDFTMEQAMDLVRVINTGGFPLSFEVIKTEPYENKN